MHIAFAILSAILVILAGPSYFFDTIRGKTKPERATWLIFSVLGIVAFYGQVKLGASLSLIFSGLDTLGSLAVFMLSIKFGVGGFSKQDKYGLTVALGGLVLSLVVHQPIAALIGVIVADGSGTLLTIQKVYKQPSSEPYLSWILFASAAVLAIFSVKHFTIGIVIYPVYIVIANYSIPIAKFISPHKTNF